MTKARRWSGIWRNDFEGSRLCPTPARECTYDTPGDAIWLTIPKSSPYYELQGHGGLYAIEFEGRRTLVRGTYGHMGGSNHEVIVDRLIALKELQPPPPPPTKEQMEAWEKECEAAPNCLTNKELKTLGVDIENAMNTAINPK